MIKKSSLPDHLGGDEPPPAYKPTPPPSYKASTPDTTTPNPTATARETQSQHHEASNSPSSSQTTASPAKQLSLWQRLKAENEEKKSSRKVTIEEATKISGRNANGYTKEDEWQDVLKGKSQESAMLYKEFW